MREKISQSAEDYLKVIYEITRLGDLATTNEIADRLGVTAASTTGMIQKLATTNPPLVEYQKHHGVSLTSVGEQMALKIIRHHRLLELFLQEKLGYTWDEVHAEADRLEHVISENLEERIAQVLGNPVYDPHGEPIPSREFQVPSLSNVRLSDLHSGDQAVVQYLGDTTPELLRYLGSIGLTPNSKLTVLDHSPYDGNLYLQISGQETAYVLGPRITQEIYVEIT